MNRAPFAIDGLTSITPIGHGGSASVYAAVDQATGQELAIKVLDGAMASTDAESSFLREVRSLEALRNVPGVVAVLAHGTTSNGDLYLVMPLLTGGSCQDLIAGGRGIPWRQAAQIVAKAAAAIQSAHDLGIWHRDIKPANILRTSGGESFVADFGIARFTDGSVQSRDGTSLTPDYAPPEVFDGAPEPRSDVFSLGATLAALVMGRPPFRSVGEDASPLAVMHRVASARAPDLTAYGAPADLAQIVERAMAKQPQDRQQAPRVLHNELGACLERHASDEVSLDAAPIVPQLLTPTIALQEEATPVSRAAGQPSARSHERINPQGGPTTSNSRMAAGFVSIAVVALLAVSAYLLVGRPGDAQTGSPADEVETAETVAVGPLGDEAVDGSVDEGPDEPADESRDQLAVAEEPTTTPVPTPEPAPTASSEPTASAEPTAAPSPTPVPTPTGPPPASDEMVQFGDQATIGISAAFVRDLLGPPQFSETRGADLVETFSDGASAAVVISVGDSVEAWGVATCGEALSINSPLARREIVLAQTSLADSTPLGSGAGEIVADYSPFLQGTGGFAAYFRHLYGGDNRSSGFRYVSVGANWRCGGPEGEHYCSATNSFQLEPIGWQGTAGADPYGLDPDSCVANEYYEYASSRNGAAIANAMDFALAR